MCPDPVARLASRVLLLDADDRILLFRGWDPADPGRGRWWFTPGGGLGPAEDPVAGAARELFEETGLPLAVDELVGPVHEQVVEFPFEGRRYRQSERFYLARCDHWEVDRSGHTEIERRSMGEHRWWSAAELRTTVDRVYPACLVELLASLTPVRGS